jgi:hypothetical protein
LSEGEESFFSIGDEIIRGVYPEPKTEILRSAQDDRRRRAQDDRRRDQDDKQSIQDDTTRFLIYY